MVLHAQREGEGGRTGQGKSGGKRERKREVISKRGELEKLWEFKLDEQTRAERGQSTPDSEGEGGRGSLSPPWHWHQQLSSGQLQRAVSDFKSLYNYCPSERPGLYSTLNVP